MRIPVSIETLRGNALLPLLEPLAELRITVFREWPYLYAGSMAYESNYLKTYANCPDSLTLLAYDGETLVGASTALPMNQAEAEMQAPLKAAGMDVDTLLYFGESLVLPDFRGRGIGSEFFYRRESHARNLGATKTCFCTVERSPSDPRRPSQRRGNESLWQRHGYAPSNLVCQFSWPDLGQTEATPKPLRFWFKDLSNS